MWLLEYLKKNINYTNFLYYFLSPIKMYILNLGLRINKENAY